MNADIAGASLIPGVPKLERRVSESREERMPQASLTEITRFIKSGGPLTKHIQLAADGAIITDGSACTMSQG
jgi:hypothetical protein